MNIWLRLLPIFCALIMVAPDPARAAVEVTILYDAFGAHSEMTRDWGFSALVEHEGQRILFDAGNDAETLARNLDAAGVDLETVDFAIVSHRHGDHIGGLSHVLAERPDLTIYTPRENFSVFGIVFPGNFFRQDTSLPARLRYFGGNPPEQIAFGSAWPDGDFRWIGETNQIAPGLHLIANHGHWGVDLDVKELSFAVETENGLVLIVGCSHPTIETIVRTATEATGRPVDMIVGGLHLLPADHDELRRVSESLRDEWRVRRIAPGHCTGEHALTIIRDVFGADFIEAGPGSLIVR